MITNRSGTSNKSFWLYVLSSLVTLLIIAITVFYLYTAYNQQQQNAELAEWQQQQNVEILAWDMLNQAEASAADGRFIDCTNILSQISAASSFYNRVQHLNNRCYTPLGKNWLAEAEALAEKGQFRAAIAQVSNIKGGDFHAKAQQLAQAWAQNIIDVARKHYVSRKGEINEAIRILSAIPENSAAYKESQQLIEQWGKLWSNNQRYYQSAFLALEDDELAIATQSAQAISAHPYWTPKQTDILLQIDAAEQTFQQIVREAEALMAQDKLDAAALKLNNLPNTQPWNSHKIGLIAQISARRVERWMPLAVWGAGAFCAYTILKRIL